MDNVKTPIDVGQSPKKSVNQYAKLLNQYFKFIAIFVFVILTIVGYMIIIKPKLEIKSVKVDKLASLTAEVKSLQSNSDLLSGYSDKIIEFSPEDERKLSQSLPDEFDLPSIVVQLSSLASDNEFIVEDIQIEPVVTSGLLDKNIKRVDIQMSVSGVGGNDYGKFSKLIKALEGSLMIFDVRAISFVPDDIGYQLELSTYYYPQN